MAYRLKEQEPLDTGLMRIAREETDEALAWLDRFDEEPDESVHEARKCFKKVRAALRLVRDEVGESFYKQENVRYRDAGRHISALRDTLVRIETIDAIVERYASQLAGDAFAPLRAALVDEHEQALEAALADRHPVEQAIAMAQAGREQIEHWPVDPTGFETVQDGLERVYKRGWKRLADAYETDDPSRFHEWRKRVKYLWYHLRLLVRLWPELFEEWADQVHDLSDYLGDDNDLRELKGFVIERQGLLEAPARQLVLSIIEAMRRSLQAQAQALGRRIYAEAPDALLDRMASYWAVWADGAASR